MSTFDAANHYFSGQGVAMIALRDPVTGKPQGFRPIGNVPDLKISIATTVVDHKESQSGARGLDGRLSTDLKVTMSATLENFIAKNLALALRGDNVFTPGGTVTAEPIKGYAGLVAALAHIKVAAVVVNLGGSPATPYVDDLTPYDYKVNLDAGSIQLNDASLIPFDTLGTAITAVTVGATTDLTVTTSAAVGSLVTLQGFTGADAALLNGKQFTILTNTGTHVTVNANTAGKTITATGTPKGLFDGVALTVNYTYSGQYTVNALTTAPIDYWLRFEGLNTAESNDPVVVDVFRFSSDPLKELALIGDTYDQFVLEGSVLADNFRVTGSKYFQARKLN